MNGLLATVIFMVLGTLVSGFQREAATVNVDVAKKLENGEALPEEKITRIGVNYDCVEGGDSAEIGSVKIHLPSSLRKSEVKLYFANEVKNILQITVTENDFTGVYYKVPHSNPDVLGTVKITTAGFDRRLTVDPAWFPKNTHKISASVEDQKEIYNFYGIKNYPISIPDTMVVENFKNITCSA